MADRAGRVDRALFAAAAPRLERAHRERRDLHQAQARTLLSLRRKLVHKQWLVEHRELQLMRAGAPQKGKPNPRYLQTRSRKLAEARVELAAVEAKIAAVLRG